MRYEDSLLYSSLIQVDGITPKKEEDYWNKGIFTLGDLSDTLDQQLSLFGNSQIEKINSIIEEADRPIKKIINIFEQKSGKKDFYRVAYSIPEDVVFLDIETTGLSHIYHYITMIGWFYKGKYNNP